MNKVKFAAAMSLVDDQYYEEAAAYQRKRRIPVWVRWGALAACLCLVVAGALALPHLIQPNGAEGGGPSNAGGLWGNGTETIGPAHREDFSPEMSQEAVSLFQDIPGVLKVYQTTVDSWFLSDSLTDYSQALTGKAVYIVPNYSEGIDRPPTGPLSYAVYVTGEDGTLTWGGGVSLPEEHSVPYALIGLTDDIILKDLSGIDYEDYIITQSTRLYTVIVWARCADGEDRFVSYSSRPEFLGLVDHVVYTLEELQQRLSNSSVGQSLTDSGDTDGSIGKQPSLGPSLDFSLSLKGTPGSRSPRTSGGTSGPHRRCPPWSR